MPSISGKQSSARSQPLTDAGPNSPRSHEPLRFDGQWRPIETAPKDGRLLLLGGCASGPSVRTGHWGLGRYNRRLKSYDRAWAGGPSPIFGPTHWMPLPPPPRDEQVSPPIRDDLPSLLAERERLVGALREIIEADAYACETGDSERMDDAIEAAAALLPPTAQAGRLREGQIPAPEPQGGDR